jgi:endoglucanase
LRAKPEHREAWIKDMRESLEGDGIGWAMWDYRGGFAVREEDGTLDAGLLRALGLKPAGE